jgi:PAS domain S-box-containing protein
VENSPDIIERFDTNLRHLYVSPVLTRITGIPAEVFLGKTCRELGMDESMVRMWEVAAQVLLATGQKQKFEFETPTLNGMRCFEMLVAPEMTGEGTISSIVCISRDITERAQLEAERKANEQVLRQYERIVSATPDCISLLDRNYIYRVINQTYLVWNQKLYDEIVGHSVSDLLGEEFFLTHAKLCLDRCLAGEPNQIVEAWLNYPDGQRRFARATYAPYVEADDRDCISVESFGWLNPDDPSG